MLSFSSIKLPQRTFMSQISNNSVRVLFFLLPLHIVPFLKIHSSSQKGPHHDTQLQHEAHAQAGHVKSAYEQQQEQQRLEAQRAEERRQIQMHQEALKAQRDRVLKEREQKMKEQQEREQQHHKEADRREQMLREEHQRSDFESDLKSGGRGKKQFDLSCSELQDLSCTVIAVIRKRAQYENMDNDIVQGEDERHTDDEEGEINAT